MSAHEMHAERFSAADIAQNGHRWRNIGPD